MIPVIDSWLFNSPSEKCIFIIIIIISVENSCGDTFYSGFLINSKYKCNNSHFWLN